MNHCLPVLRGCHNLTTRLVPVAKQCHSREASSHIEEAAKRVGPHVDDVVALLDGPMDPRLAEAR